MSKLHPVHLVMVTETNNNKFYDMTPKGDVIEIRYGRINASCNTYMKPISEWDKIYRSKIRKGYVDKSELIADVAMSSEQDTAEYQPISDKAVAELVNRLQKFAKKVIAANYSVRTNQVTQSMIDEAQELLNLLLKAESVKAFNDLLLQLYAVIPRRMGNVSDHLAKADGQFARIIAKEQSLLDTLRGQVVAVNDEYNNQTETEFERHYTILEAFGIRIESTTESDIIRIKKELGEDACRYRDSWRIVNLKQKERFEQFLSDSHMSKK